MSPKGTGQRVPSLKEKPQTRAILPPKHNSRSCFPLKDERCEFEPLSHTHTVSKTYRRLRCLLQRYRWHETRRENDRVNSTIRDRDREFR